MKTIIFSLSMLALLYVPVSADDKFDSQNNSAVIPRNGMSKSKIAAISLSSIGGACILSSIPIYLKAHSIAQGKGFVPIESNITYLIGDCFLFGGLLFEGIAIPFYIKDARSKKKKNFAMQLKINSVDMLYNF